MPLQSAPKLDYRAIGRALKHAQYVFVLLAVGELVATILTAGYALGFDSLHNLFELGLLGLNRQACSLASKNRSHHEQAIYYGMSAAGLVMIATATGVFTLLGLTHGTKVDHAQLALALALVSVATNIVMANRIPHVEEDHNAESVWRHLLSDAGSAALAAAAYVVIMLAGQAWSWADPAAALAGAALMVAANQGIVLRAWKLVQQNGQ